MDPMGNRYAPGKANIAMEHLSFADVFPIEMGIFPLLSMLAYQRLLGRYPRLPLSPPQRNSETESVGEGSGVSSKGMWELLCYLGNNCSS